MKKDPVAYERWLLAESEKAHHSAYGWMTMKLAAAILRLLIRVHYNEETQTPSRARRPR